MPSKAKNKGKYLESLVARMIQESWGLEDHEVHRNQTSGIFHTEYGDIFFKYLNIIIECKNQESWDLKHVLTWSKPITDWWQQLMKDVERFKQRFETEPLYALVIGRSHYPKFIIFDIKNMQKTPVLKGLSKSIEPFIKQLPSYCIVKHSKLVTFLSDAIESLKTFVI